MNFTCVKRKEFYAEFIKTFQNKWKERNGNTFKWQTTEQMFDKKELNRGAEGIVYKINFKDEPNSIKNKNFILKQINLKIITETKEVSQDILNAEPDALYKKFSSKSAFHDPIFIELISMTLINQLVFQGICPNFTCNFFWDYNICKELSVYSEFINGGDFHSWAKEEHSNETWMNAFFQVMIGLIAMKRYFNMTHADFHTGNLLVQKIRPGGYWKYKIDDKIYYLPNLGFQILLNDFGFAWIPNKLYIEWYYHDYLTEVTDYGTHFFDISQFIESIQADYTLPEDFSNKIKKEFSNSLQYIYSKKYYREKLKSLKEDGAGKRKIQKIQKIIDTYPTSKKSPGTLTDKLHDMFNKSLFTEEPKNKTLIETYSLNKEFDKTKLEKVFLELVL